jgi:hypothetical protein
MSSSIIELRQQDATTVANNGDYTVNLGNSLLLNDGDQIVIKNVYIDTKQDNKQTNRIVIDDSNNEFSVMSTLYIKDYYQNADFLFNDKDGSGIQHPDGYNYVLSYGFAGQPTARRLIKMTIVGGNNTGEADSFDTSLIYNDPNGKEQKVGCRIEVTKHQKDVQVEINGSPNLNLVYKPQNIGVEFDPNTDVFFSSNTVFDDNNVDLEFDNDGNILNVTGSSEEIISGDAINPITFQVTIPIPHGSYEPESLAKLITDELSAQKFTQIRTKPINITQTNPIFVPLQNPSEDIYVSQFPTKSPFFTSQKQLQADADYATNGLAQIFFTRHDGESIMQIDPNSANDYIIGANQMSLVYDDSLNKFVFQQIHSPIFTGAGDAVQNCVRVGETSGGNFFTATANSGVIFTAPASIQTENLLFNHMGFDHTLFSASTQITTPANYNNLVNTKSLQYTLIEGQNITGALKSIDDFYKKDATTFNQSTPLAAGDIIVDNLNSIVGSATEGNGGNAPLKFGYYLIEVGGLPYTHLTNSQKSNKRNQKIKSIVGRYYATQDYTEDGGAGSLAVTYSGVPQYIDSLEVRILNPDNSLATVGSDNTVFIEVIRANSEN